MALKRIIDKAKFDTLPDAMKAEYVKDTDGNYTLDVEGESAPEAIGELRRAHTRTKGELTDAKEALFAANEKLDAGKHKETRSSGDIDKIEASWMEKLAAEKQAGVDAKAKSDKTISDMVIGERALALAKEISTSPALLLPHIIGRIKADLTSNDTPTATFVDKDGIATSADMLKQEFVANEDFASIMIGSKAKGGGAPDKDTQDKGGARGRDTSNEKPQLLSDMNPKELVAEMQARRDSADN